MLADATLLHKTNHALSLRENRHVVCTPSQTIGEGISEEMSEHKVPLIWTQVALSGWAGFQLSVIGWPVSL